MGISIRQIKGLQEALDSKVQDSVVQALIERIQELENRLNVLTNNGEITKIEISDEI